MRFRLSPLARRWTLVVGPIVSIFIAIGALFLGGVKWGRPSAPLTPAQAPYYDPAPFTQLAPGVKQFHLYATDGLQPLAGGGSLYIWGYSTENRRGSAKLSGPTIVVDEGDQVEVVLTNLGPANPDVIGMNHTIHLHGLDVPEWTDGVLTTVQPGESFTYAFTATHAGTYWYHCHVDTIQHLTMGMYGTVVVRARNGAPQAWTNGPSYDREYTMLLSEADPVWNTAVEHATSYNRTSYNPSYFFINGRSFPDTMNDPSDMIHGKKGDRVLVRLINAGYTWKSMHMHGFHFDVIAGDGRPLPQPESKDTLSIGPGERYDILVTFDQTGTYPFHSHAITDNLNNGHYPGGIHTMVQVDDGAAPAAGADQGGHDHTAAPALPDLTKVSYLKLGELRAHLHGDPWLLTARPLMADGVLLAPTDFVAKALGAEITVDAAGNVATGGKEIPLSPPARKVGDSWLVPVRPLADYFGLPMVYTSETGELLIGTTASDALIASRSLVAPPAVQVAQAPAAVAPPVPAPAQPSPAAPPVHAAAPQPAAGASGADGKLVVIHSFAFDPPELQVKAGTTVVWVNWDSIEHAIRENNGTFSSGQFGQGEKFQYTFQQPGTYDYFCAVHPEMKGRIVVTN